VYSCACEQTEENANMLFVMSAMRNIQKHRRDHRGVSSGKMNWSSLVTMSYTTCRYMLTCGGVQRIIWEVHSGLIIRRVVLSVRGCLMRGISEWGCFVLRKNRDFVISEWWCFVSRKFVVFYFRSPGWVSWECGRKSVFDPWTDSGGWSVNCVGECCCVTRFCKANSWRDFNILINKC
jgi:hypothetical protein